MFQAGGRHRFGNAHFQVFPGEVLDAGLEFLGCLPLLKSTNDQNRHIGTQRRQTRRVDFRGVRIESEPGRHQYRYSDRLVETFDHASDVLFEVLVVFILDANDKAARSHRQAVHVFALILPPTGTAKT